MAGKARHLMHEKAPKGKKKQKKTRQGKARQFIQKHVNASKGRVTQSKKRQDKTYKGN